MDQPLTDALGLGRLQRVDPRRVWKNEALDLTPWLQQNLDVLSSALGVTILPIQREVPVGDFKLDLLGEDDHGRPVIVENQLDPTDHSHLGQLLVYASGLEAAIVVWVTSRFRPEHRRALDWLNERTDEAVQFFGVELDLVQIAGSPLAPVFRVVAQPNNWQKGFKEQATVARSTESKQQRADFYASVMEAITARRPGFRPPKTSPDWVGMNSGPFGFYSISFARGNRLRVEVYLDLQDQEKTKRLFDLLAADRPTIEQGMEEMLTWERLDDSRASRIALYHPLPDLNDPVSVAEARDWAAARLARLMEVLDDRLRSEARRLRSS